MPRRWRLALELVVAVVVVALVARTIAANWDSFRALHFTLVLRPAWLALSVVSLALVSALQIESWRRLLAGWGQRLRFAAGARIWFLANLGRYVPGKVWSVAGMVVLAEREGVQRWASAASAVAVQAVGIGTAAALVAAATPHAYSPVRVAAAALLGLGTVALLAWKGALPRVGRLVGAAGEWRALPAGAVFAGAALTLLSWGVYGFAFWALGRGIGLPPVLPLADAAGVFALGYIVGLLALFAPGGIGFREATFLALLTPYLGGGGALALSLASRLELTLTEAAAGLGALALGGRKGRESLERRP
ncbi:MAG TPA: lysylphosphatidylglycerol synthase domain-containing protein [Gemmatimonadales bacterium]|nr:lysylphosphatidylglycerol synthase domain-containing protein [Gemmatimonadales bacterium]